MLLRLVSLWIRKQREESPAFTKMKAEAFAKWGNLKIVLIALVGAVMGQAVVWYTGQSYALFFLEKMLKVDGVTTNILMAIALALATPAFVFWAGCQTGWVASRSSWQGAWQRPAIPKKPIRRRSTSRQ
jgi:hypothetical protein